VDPRQDGDRVAHYAEEQEAQAEGDLGHLSGAPCEEEEPHAHGGAGEDLDPEADREPPHRPLRTLLVGRPERAIEGPTAGPDAVPSGSVIRLSLRPRGLRALILATAAVPALAAPSADPGIEFAYLNATHTNLDGSLAPIQEGPLTVRLSSPDHRLLVHRNRLVLTPGASADPDAVMEAEVEGEGDLIADLEGGGVVGTRFEDRVAAPRQNVSVAGKARVTRDATSYAIALVEGPASVPLRIQSRVAGQVVGVCRGLALFAPMSCDRLAAALATVQVPLPGPEKAFVLPRERLTEPERAYLDRFVAR
jgi:hypothetical protein